MQKCNTSFFVLICEVMKLEAKYEEGLEEIKHLSYLANKFGKDNSNNLGIKKYENEELKKQIDDILKQISELQLDSDMQSYYNLYKEKNELLMKFWACEAEIGYIQSSLIFDCVCDDEADTKIINERSKLEIQNSIITKELEDINLKMEAIYGS